MSGIKHVGVYLYGQWIVNLSTFWGWYMGMLKTYKASIDGHCERPYMVYITRLCDMAAHLRTILTHSDLTIPVRGGRCALGTWQGIFLLEHRTHPHHRRITVTVQGE